MTTGIGLFNELSRLNNELVNMQRQLSQQNAELEELNQLKNQFLGMAAHDLRGPLTVIMAYIEFVRAEAGEALSAEHRDFLDTCLMAARNMEQHVDAFLDLAVIESGHLRLDLAPETAATITQGALALAQLLAERKMVTMSLQVSQSPRVIMADAARLQNVLVNLITNALEYSPSGGSVSVTVEWVGDELLFTVRDQGPGIPAGDQERIFQPFARTGAHKTAGERSVGLGLAIARQIVVAHQGRIWVESAPGQGAAFYVAIPQDGGSGVCG